MPSGSLKYIDSSMPRSGGDVLDGADRLDPGLEPETGEVEEAQEGLVAEVEEEVRRPLVVTVLGQLDQREPQQPLVELDGLLDI